jgi:hypothetical protein
MGPTSGSKRVAVEGVLTAGHKDLAVEVGFEPAREWGAEDVALWPGRRGYPVEVLLNGVRFRSAIVSRMGRRFVLVDESLARRAGSSIGKRVRLTVWADVQASDKDVPPSAPPKANDAAPQARTRTTAARVSLSAGRTRGKR